MSTIGPLLLIPVIVFVVIIGNGVLVGAIFNGRHSGFIAALLLTAAVTISLAGIFALSAICMFATGGRL